MSFFTKFLFISLLFEVFEMRERGHQLIFNRTTDVDSAPCGGVENANFVRERERESNNGLLEIICNHHQTSLRGIRDIFIGYSYIFFNRCYFSIIFYKQFLKFE